MRQGGGGHSLCVGVRRGSEAGMRTKISVCVCVDKSRAGTDGQKQNIACRHTMRSRRRGGEGVS